MKNSPRTALPSRRYLSRWTNGGLEAALVVAGALGAAHDDVVAGVDELLGLDAERRPVVGDLGEVAHDRVAALDLAAERQLVGGDPDGVLGERLLQGGQVAAPEGFVGGPGGVDDSTCLLLCLAPPRYPRNPAEPGRKPLAAGLPPG